MIETLFSELTLPCDKFKHYFPLYERHFSKFKMRSPKILEIGVQFGGSAELWRSYFGEGTKVHGVDVAPMCSETEYLQLSVGDQGSEQFWSAAFSGELTELFDMVIDDGSHQNAHQITTLVNTYKLLKDGGIYWCEDVHTSYYNNSRVHDGGYRNPKSFIEFTKNLIDVLNSNHTHYAIGVGPTDGPHVDQMYVDLFNQIQGIHFYDSVVVIEKGVPFEFKRVKHPGRQE